MGIGGHRIMKTDLQRRCTIEINLLPGRRGWEPRVVVGVAALLVAHFTGPEVGRIIVLVLGTIPWLILVIAERMEQAQGRSLGMRWGTRLYGLALVGYALLLLYGPHRD